MCGLMSVDTTGAEIYDLNFDYPQLEWFFIQLALKLHLENEPRSLHDEDAAPRPVIDIACLAAGQ